jgi:mono/diheme cytochrome c family protein
MARLPVVVSVIVASAALWAGCTSSGGGDAPAVPAAAGGTPDPVLVHGRDVFVERCTRCHGASGGGGAGPRINDGRLLRDFPDPAQQEAVVRNGRKGMPSFRDKLSDDDIAAVVRYTREVLTKS